MSRAEVTDALPAGPVPEPGGGQARMCVFPGGGRSSPQWNSLSPGVYFEVGEALADEGKEKKVVACRKHGGRSSSTSLDIALAWEPAFRSSVDVQHRRVPIEPCVQHNPHWMLVQSAGTAGHRFQAAYAVRAVLVVCLAQVLHVVLPVLLQVAEMTRVLIADPVA
eukprot:scpid55398/ scgid31216/ 